MLRTKKAVLVELLYIMAWVIVIFVVMPRMCKGLAYSIYYQPNPDRLEQLINENKRRAYLAHNLLAAKNYRFLFDKVNNKDIDFCIVVLTDSRPSNPKYLTQTVASIARQLKKLTNRYSFAVYNVGGSGHTEAFEVAKFVPVIHNETVPLLHNRNSYDLQKIGYTSAMRWCMDRKARFSVVLEDDVVAEKNFMSKLQFVLKRCLADKEGKKWAFLKLFYPEKFQGWGNSPSNVVELLMFTSLFSFLLTFLSAIVFFGPMAIDLNTWRVYTKRPIMYFRLVFTHLCVLFVLLSLGRAHWEEMRKGSLFFISVVEAKGCCTPAVVYPGTHLKEIVEFLESRTSSRSFPYDLIMDQFVDEKGLNKLLTVPNLVNHIGMISSLSVKGRKRVSEFDLLFPPHF